MSLLAMQQWLNFLTQLYISSQWIDVQYMVAFIISSRHVFSGYSRSWWTMLHFSFWLLLSCFPNMYSQGTLDHGEPIYVFLLNDLGMIRCFALHTVSVTLTKEQLSEGHQSKATSLITPDIFANHYLSDFLETICSQNNWLAVSHMHMMPWSLSHFFIPFRNFFSNL